MAVGYFATSNISADLACSLSFGIPKSIEAVSTVMSTVPLPLSLSTTMVPEDRSNFPRHTDMPPK